MNIAYLIAAHNAPNHLRRLVQRLASPHSKVYIHVDRKTPLDAYLHLAGPDVELLHDRVAVYWGDFTLVDAVLMLLRVALSSDYRFDRAVLLSGSDYPICTSNDIDDFFGLNPDFEYIAAVRMPNEEFSKPISRLTNYHHAGGDSRVKKIGFQLLCRFGLMRTQRDYRTRLGPLDPYAGPTWWALSRNACEHIINFIARNPGLVKFYRNTYLPDESFFHTIIANSSFGSKLKPEITYADWSKGGAHPATLSLTDVERVMNLRWRADSNEAGTSGFLFARKFPEDSEQIVVAIDSYPAGFSFKPL